MKEPRCPKCAGAALVRDDYGTGNDREEAIRCLTCGWRIAKPRPETEKPTGKPMYYGTLLPCALDGCTGKARADNATGLCRACSAVLANWENSKRTTPAPLVRINGRWIRNPARRAAA